MNWTLFVVWSLLLIAGVGRAAYLAGFSRAKRGFERPPSSKAERRRQRRALRRREPVDPL